MKFKELGNSDLVLSRIGLGTWAIGGGEWGMGWGDQDTTDSVHTILEALSVGINWIDTAHAYGFGEAEVAVGKALREWKSDDVIVATKCGVLPMENNRPRRFISPETIREEIEGSLRRIGRDWIDLYQIHWPEPMENLVESWQALQDLKKEGKVRWVGVCNCWTDELEILSDISTITSNQPMYSMLAREVEQDVLPWCERHETGVLAYSPMHSGLLTGKVSKAWLDSLPANDWRKHKTDHPVVEPLQSEDGMKAFLDFQDQLKAFGQETGRTVGQVAVAWTLRRDEITSSIVGARKKGQIVETVKAVDLELLPDEQVFLGGLLEDFSGDY